ncbi:MAG TPA: aldo/keto reductase, partial [Acidimicrobiales bacterium]
DSIGEIVKMKDEGKIRHIGICNVTETELHRAQRHTPIVSVQNRYNVSDRSSESMVELCEQESMVFLPWAPILDIDENGATVEIAQNHQCTPRQVVLAWLLARSPNILPIPGTGSTGHLEENVDAAGITLDPHEIEALTAGKR